MPALGVSCKMDCTAQLHSSLLPTTSTVATLRAGWSAARRAGWPPQGGRRAPPCSCWGLGA